MRSFILVLSLTTSLLVGCDPGGACVKEGKPGSNIDLGSCVVNNKKSMCSKGEFHAGSGKEAVALCRSRGFTSARGATAPTAADIDKDADAGKTITLFPPLAP